jgi:hypothetical protein
MGHFDIDFAQSIQQDGVYLTMLRDPIMRLISLYDFWRSYTWDFIRTNLPPLPTNGPAVAKSCTFLEFLGTNNEFSKTHISNPAARQLLGHRFKELERREDGQV